MSCVGQPGFNIGSLNGINLLTEEKTDIVEIENIVVWSFIFNEI